MSDWKRIKRIRRKRLLELRREFNKRRGYR